MPKDELSISQMSAEQLISYLNILSQRQAEYSKLKIKKTEELIPIDQSRSKLRADIQNISEKMKQTKIEVAACKYALKAEANS